jgi:Arc/MetJ-type ribon-helix-helix transcriptional regulator
MTKFTTVSIPEPLYKKVKEFIKDTGFTSSSDFVTFVLREIFMEAEVKSKTSRKKKLVYDRLKALGYIK